MCVGICVLLAIVYVLSRTSGDASAQALLNNTPKSPNANASPQVHAPVPVMVPDATMTTTQDITTGADTSPTTPSSTVLETTTSSSGALRGSDSVVVTPTSEDADKCAGLVDPNNLDMGAIRAAAFARTPPHIIECAEAKRGGSQDACHLPSEERYVAVKQKGATIWMTGCSGAGKTTIATELEDMLIKKYGKHVYRLDGDNLRTGLNRDLTFTEADRAESVRRTGELATLFADAGVITLVGLISPYREDRDMVRKRHEDQDIPFYEVFLDVPIEELKKRDPKGQYAKVSLHRKFFFFYLAGLVLFPYADILSFFFFIAIFNLRWKQENSNTSLASMIPMKSHSIPKLSSERMNLHWKNRFKFSSIGCTWMESSKVHQSSHLPVFPTPMVMS